MCGGSTTVEAPTPSATELAIQQEQLDLLRESSARDKLMDPYLMQEMGYRINEDGTISKMTDEEYYNSLGETDKLSYDISKLASQRALSAYKGELEIDPSVTRSYGEAETNLRERMSRQLGPGWETSTAGIKALSDLAQRKAETEYAVSHGEMTSSTAVANQQQQASLQKMLDSMTAINNRTSTPSQLASGYQMPLSWYAQQRQNQLQANMANASNSLTSRGQNMSFLSNLMPRFSYLM